MGHRYEAKVKIGTHDGSFHCDEVLACVFLKLLPEYEDAEIVRTRDPEILRKCDVVVDVGGVYDHEARRYDHHQTSFSLTMGDITGGKIHSDTPLSSAGLVYWHYHRGIFKSLLPTDPEGKGYSNKQLQDAFEFLYRQFVREIDDIDNGGGDCDEDKVSLTCTKQCPPDKMFPTEWRGLMDGDLERASGIDGMKFVHKSGHMAVGKNKETIIKMIDRILYGLYQ